MFVMCEGIFFFAVGLSGDEMAFDGLLLFAVFSVAYLADFIS